MNFRQLLLLVLLIPLMTVAEDTTPNIEAVGKVIDDSVYLGTDEWERWPKYPDFDDYVSTRFKDGSGWDYRSVERTIDYNDRQDVAWFDEVLYSETNGRIRGTGELSES